MNLSIGVLVVLYPIELQVNLLQNNHLMKPVKSQLFSFNSNSDTYSALAYGIIFFLRIISSSFANSQKWTLVRKSNYATEEGRGVWGTYALDQNQPFDIFMTANGDHILLVAPS